MKIIQNTFWLLASLILGVSAPVEAQVLKGFGKKLEKKIEQRIERKADRQVDKALDKADKKTDESIEGAFSKPKSKAEEKKLSNAANTRGTVAARPDQAMVLMGSSCEDFSWFKKGAILAYEALGKKGNVTAEIEMHVRDLNSQGGKTIAQIEATLSSPNFENLDYPMNYICEGDKIYMDVASMMKAMMEKNPEMKNQAVQDAFDHMEIDFSEGFASFPKTMYPGMVLEDLNFSFKTEIEASEMSFHTTVTDRQVVAREKVTTTAGTFECLKIRSSTNTVLKVMGMNQNMPATTEHLWLAPGIGMIKQETRSDKDVTTMQLKAYKM